MFFLLAKNIFKICILIASKCVNFKKTNKFLNKFSIKINYAKRFSVVRANTFHLFMQQTCKQTSTVQQTVCFRLFCSHGGVFVWCFYVHIILDINFSRSYSYYFAWKIIILEFIANIAVIDLNIHYIMRSFLFLFNPKALWHNHNGLI